MKARHELKHRLNYADYMVLRSRIGAILSQDKHAAEKGEYLVRSLYFDTPQDSALKDKINGVNHREKFRIRIYNHDSSHISLEKKSKHNNLCYKQGTRMNKQEVEAILRGDTEWMLDANERPLLQEFYSKTKGQLLTAKTIVDYCREPFLYPAGNVRITFDREIKTGLYRKELFARDLPLIPAGDELVILEVKYDEFIPDFILNLLQIGHRQAAACSKYAMCRMYG